MQRKSRVEPPTGPRLIPFLFLSLFTTISAAWGQSAPPNDIFDNRIELVGPVTNVVASNVGATSEPGEPNHASRKVAKSVWWTWTAPADISVSIDTLGSSFDTVLAVYTGGSVNGLTFVAGNDDISAGLLQSRVVFQASSGTNYQIAVDGFGAQEGAVALRLREGPLPPEIVAGPVDTKGALATAVSLGVTVLGDAPLSFQWSKDGSDIPDGTNSTYQIASVTSADAGVYKVSVTNVAGVATSAPAILTVSPIVLQTQPVSTTVSAGYSVSLKVSAISAAPLYYQWQKNQVPIPGANTTQYAIATTQLADAGAYSVVVTSDSGEATTSNAVLSVVAPYTFTTLAGKAQVSGTNDGPGGVARFYYPHGIALDADGNVYVSEIGNESIRRIKPDSTVSTVIRLRAPQTGRYEPFGGPWGVAVDSAGKVYISDTASNTILKVLPDGTVNTLAGRPGIGGFADGTNTDALFRTPAALLADAAGNLLVADWQNNAIRRITPEGVVSTVATKSSLIQPSGLGQDNQGTIFASEEGRNSLTSVSTNGIITKLTGVIGGPHGAAVDALGNIYTAEMNTSRILKVTREGSTTPIGGRFQYGGSANGAGTQALFWEPRGIVADKSGTVYVTDYNNHTIRKGVPFAVTNLLQDQTALVGSTINLSIDAWGAAPLYFQWYFGTNVLTGQTTNSLTLGPLKVSDAGVYSVQIRDENGNNISFQSVVSISNPSLIESVQVTGAGMFQMLFRHLDGSLPADLSKVSVQWCDEFTTSGTNWQSAPPNLSVANGFILFEETNSLGTARYYRVREQ